MQVLCVAESTLRYTWMETHFPHILHLNWPVDWAHYTDVFVLSQNERTATRLFVTYGVRWARLVHTILLRTFNRTHLIIKALLQLTSCIPQMKASVHRPLQQPMVNATLVFPFHVGPCTSKPTENHHSCWPGCGCRTTPAATRRAVSTWYTSRRYQSVKPYLLAAVIPLRPQSSTFYQREDITDL